MAVRLQRSRPHSASPSICMKYLVWANGNKSTREKCSRNAHTQTGPSARAAAFQRFRSAALQDGPGAGLAWNTLNPLLLFSLPPASPTPSHSFKFPRLRESTFFNCYFHRHFPLTYIFLCCSGKDLCKSYSSLLS